MTDRHYGQTAVCLHCGQPIEAKRPTFADSPNPLWRSQISNAAGCPVSKSWHVPQQHGEPVSSVDDATTPEVASRSGS